MKAHPRRYAAFVLLLVAAALSFWLLDRIDVAALTARMERLPYGALMLILFAAPVVGVPLSALLIVVGVTLPLPLGVASVVAVLVAHHLLVYPLTRTRLCRFVQRKLRGRGLLPDKPTRDRLGSDLLFILAATWVPGVSYIFKVALTALAGIPFKTYFAAGVLSQSLAALPYLLLGRMAEDSLGWVGAGLFVLAAATWLLKSAVFKPGARSPLTQRVQRP